MAKPLTAYLEAVDNKSPTTRGFSRDGGQSIRTWYLLDSPDTQDVNDAIVTLVGTTNFLTSDGRLQRINPVADPEQPWLIGDSVQQIYGIHFEQYVDNGGPTPTPVPDLINPVFPGFAAYEAYAFVVKSVDQIYPLLPDNQIAMNNGQWYNVSNTNQTFKYATEWKRNCWATPKPQAQSHTARQGQMLFRTPSAAVPANTGYPGTPKMFLPNQIVDVHWYGVPLRYITSPNSYIQRWVGFVNQNQLPPNPGTGRNQDGYWPGLGVYPPGSMLLLNYEIMKQYPPVVPSLQFVNGIGSDPGGSIFATDKLVDIVFHFLYTSRQAAPGDVNLNYFDSINKNFLPNSGKPAGWNLQPWLVNRRFYLASSDPSQTPGALETPEWLSAPFELLFSDPDYLSGQGISTF